MLRFRRHQLQRDDVVRAAVARLPDVVGHAHAFAAELARECEARDLARAIAVGVTSGLTARLSPVHHVAVRMVAAERGVSRSMAGREWDERAVIDAVERGERIEGAVIAALSLHDTSFQKHVSFVNCAFVGDVDFSRTLFERGARFVACTFGGEVCFVAARVTGDLEFRAAIFRGSVNFDRMSVKGKLEMRAPSDGNDVRLLQSGALQEQRFVTQPFVRFHEIARFSQMHVTGEANLGSAQFHRWANFYDARIEGSLLLRIDRAKGNRLLDVSFPPVRFYGGLRLRDARIGGDLNLYGAQFWGTADFSYASVRGTTFLCDPETHPSERQDPRTFCRFHPKPVWRRGPAGQAVPGGTQPTQVTVRRRAGRSAEEPASVRHEIKGELPRTKKLETQYLARGKKVTCFQTEELLCRAEFDAASFCGGLAMRGDVFGQPDIVASLRDATYGRLEMRNAESKPHYLYLTRVIACAEETETHEFERTAWIQLESTLHGMGRTQLANSVYRSRMWREVRWAALPVRAWRALWCALSGYGTLPALIAAWCLVTIAGFALAYHLSEPSCGFARALEKSVSYFFPFSLPLGDHPKGADYGATAERLVGWFLVPALAAALVGLLQRRAKAELKFMIEQE